MTQTVIETFNLSKTYRLKGRKAKITALDDITFKINKNEKFGLLGPNGAGKTTLVSILTTLLNPTSGYATINGVNILKRPNSIKPKIALMLGSDMLYHRATGYANLKFFCKIYEIRDYKVKIQEIAKEFELTKWLNEYVNRYSTGMKVKLALCRILLLNPEILFLDEPTLGLDVKTTNLIIDKLNNMNKTIILTSHNMTVVERVCDRIAFIDKGRIVKIGSQEELRKIMHKGIKFTIEINQIRDKLKTELNHQEFILETKDTPKGIITFLNERENLNELLKILSKYPVLRVKEEEISIEELFMKLF